MDAHGLVNNEWFTEAFDKRRQWVMAHCRDLNMGGVMRTTQRSESSNSFFKKFEQKSGTLVEFWMRFESAMDHQRHTQKRLDHENRHSTPAPGTHLPMEEYAANVYTREVFKEFQLEVICSIDTCKTGGYAEVDGVEVTAVKDSIRQKSFNVEYNPGTQTTQSALYDV
ncbi:protein FAR-RED IMPAIRED RESPONSE 1-like isoform X2 [Silene latifolia]|uniref:protein FAR-RED IMPAIRED RESPONSE 1-like isoform X2 n=1 Tax=Silene latifolia TaxID=37657 RepID=UPI003D76C046